MLSVDKKAIIIVIILFSSRFPDDTASSIAITHSVVVNRQRMPPLTVQT